MNLGFKLKIYPTIFLGLNLKVFAYVQTWKEISKICFRLNIKSNLKNFFRFKTQSFLSFEPQNEPENFHRFKSQPTILF